MSSPCFPFFPTFSAELKRRESLHLAFPISLHLVLALNVGKSSPCLPYFPTISAEPERKESLRPAFPTLSAGSKHREVFALPSLFPYI